MAGFDKYAFSWIQTCVLNEFSYHRYFKELELFTFYMIPYTVQDGFCVKQSMLFELYRI